MALPRRSLLRGAAALAAALSLPVPRAAAAGLPLEQRLQVCQPQGDPLQELLRRNREFAAVWAQAQESGDPLERARLLQDAWPLHCQVRPGALAEGQRPWAAVLACADSRVAPEWLFASGSGELFEVRSAGNTAFDAGVASLEYAVAELAVPLILVMGHSGCGAVKAALGSAPLTPLLEDLVRPIRQALPAGEAALPEDAAAEAAVLERAVKANASAAAAALPRRSALLQQAVAEGRLRIQPAYCDIGSGRVSLV